MTYTMSILREPNRRTLFRIVYDNKVVFQTYKREDAMAALAAYAAIQNAKIAA